MKKILIIALGFCLLLSSCAYDNFDEPTSEITGTVMYQGTPIGVRSNTLSLLLYQTGFQTYTSVSVAVKQDGTFHALMADGTYRLINPTGTTQPWVYRTDTVKFDLVGTASVDYEVTPYYMINNDTYTKSGTNMTANCKLAKIATTATLENATLYVSRTALCDQNYKEASQQLSAASITDLNNVNFTVAIPARLITQGYCFVRIGVKATQASERLYTQVQKVTF
jgi:hypothetical protein